MVEPSLKTAVPSPCIDVCKLNADGLCLGCRRSLSEIAEWSRASDARRLEIVNALKSRVLRP
jgi:predicted Fe-S protein YdhL (DUF1289 family)